MSHTFEWEDDREISSCGDVKAPDDKQCVWIHHNGDYSGDATLVVPEELWEQMIQSAAEASAERPIAGHVEFKLPAKLLADFSNNATIREAIGALEDLIR